MLMKEAFKKMSSQALRKIVRNKNGTMQIMRQLAYGTLVNRRGKR